MKAAWWWIDRWRKSTAYTDMTVEARGAYRELLDELWLRDGILPENDRILSRIVGDSRAWNRVRESVLSRFTEVRSQDGKLVGYRNDTHDEIQAESKKRADRQARYRNKQRNVTPNVPASPSPSPSPSLTTEERKNVARPCDHAFARKRFAETGRLTVCLCGEEFRSAAANPFVPDRAARETLERDALRLTGEIAALTGEDGHAVFAQAAHYDGAKRQKFNPATMTDERLLATVSDLKASLKAVQAKQAARKAQ